MRDDDDDRLVMFITTMCGSRSQFDLNAASSRSFPLTFVALTFFLGELNTQFYYTHFFTVYRLL